MKHLLVSLAIACGIWVPLQPAPAAMPDTVVTLAGGSSLAMGAYAQADARWAPQRPMASAFIAPASGSRLRPPRGHLRAN